MSDTLDDLHLSLTNLPALQSSLLLPTQQLPVFTSLRELKGFSASVQCHVDRLDRRRMQGQRHPPEIIEWKALDKPHELQ